MGSFLYKVIYWRKTPPRNRDLYHSNLIVFSDYQEGDMLDKSKKTNRQLPQRAAIQKLSLNDASSQKVIIVRFKTSNESFNVPDVGGGSVIR